jgi:hypothetical protein
VSSDAERLSRTLMEFFSFLPKELLPVNGSSTVKRGASTLELGASPLVKGVTGSAIPVFGLVKSRDTIPDYPSKRDYIKLMYDTMEGYHHEGICTVK